MKLLPRSQLVKTGPIDQAQWNYSLLLGPLQRQRFRMIARLLRGQRFGRLLEVGYGSGILMPTLAEHCDELYGLDIHQCPADVERVLSDAGVSAELATGTATDLPYPDDFFDAIVSVSALEYVEPQAKMVQEFARTCRSGATLLAICPAQSPFLDRALEVLTGDNANYYFADRRQRLLPALEEHFVLRRQVVFPPILSRVGLPVYHAWELKYTK